jgi:hypothetical protein
VPSLFILAVGVSIRPVVPKSLALNGKLRSVSKNVHKYQKVEKLKRDLRDKTEVSIVKH